SRLPSRVMAQQPSEAATALASSTADAAPTAAAAATDIFLELAATVGQAAPAQRLIDYKLKNDPTSRPRFYAIVDFDQPSTSKRFYVFDTVEKRVSTYYVAHGRASGENIAEKFSNQNKSNSSSLGIYRTLNEYNGQHGRSLRLEGLEPTNSNALTRAVVMHTADYVSEAFIRQTGRLGRSEGCFAVEKSVGDTLINELKNGAYIIAAKG
ncbi:MAG TPA: murein L,D-transpeptidase catalytic domain family protein, partial [Pyrinomonadaceae bacterium]|nr:murein L,D-transpeptidase catalytic domain family protein [Pyrinomonadaceae bacterium]